ncbi:uncharacterized protein KY384_002483 [Bacidia gigantensis]|uniref:uncharacterized protein n=1 Tax=Bacidia gigantensis TaxID=2732470 RepID=UPI001D056C48|nr:uncharacterized protein KY384_002483 [Bacidia gigantensis]KAG8532606.1 hypothetical protein KY384_002483 [Bacidia gigantensis]
MDAFSSCCGTRRKRDEDTEALLAHYEDDTVLQRSVHQKLHSFQMYRALSMGYLPSTEQLIANLRTFLASDFLTPDEPDLSDSGILLLKDTKQWIRTFIEMLRVKNEEDQIQDFLWYLSQSRVQLNTNQLAKSASNAKAQADASAAYESVRTVGSLLLTNSDFRLFLGDLGTIGRQVFSDTAFSLSNAAQETGKRLEPSDKDHEALIDVEVEADQPPTAKDLGDGAAQISKTMGEGLVKTGQDAVSSLQVNVSGQQKDTLIHRLKEAVSKLQTRRDYSDSVSTIGLLFKRYALAYSRVIDKTVSATGESVNVNPELDRAVKNLWLLIKSFGSPEEWEKLEQALNKVVQHSQSDPEFENLMTDTGNALQKLLSDPSFFDSVEERLRELKDKLRRVDTESSLRNDVGDALSQLQVTTQSVLQDQQVSSLITTTSKIVDILSPKSHIFNQELIQDSLQVFIPLLINAIQYVPIPRVEVSVPEMDLLLENLVIEPGRTVNNTSFLPFKLKIETYNDLEIRKAHTQRTTASTTNLVTIAVNGLSIRADEVGFWLRAHKGLLFHLADEGIASFQLDEKGIDIAIDIEVGKERLESILTLRKVRVHVHKLNYQLRKSKISWLAWLLKPLLRPIVRKVLETQIATAIADGLHAANRELLFARERLRATRISDPQDVRTFFKAVITRLTPAEDPDVYAAVGVKPSKGIFRGVYAPGSLVKLWEEEARFARQKVEDNEVNSRGWRNEIFDVKGGENGLLGMSG